MKRIGLLVAVALGTVVPALGTALAQQYPGESMLQEYFRRETQRLAQRCLQEVQRAEDWPRLREKYRRQLLDMLGLWPLPPRTPLRATVTGKIRHDDFTVEKLHFQSMPGLYVTGNLYVPKGRGPFPAILYVCGHARVKKNGISYGNKVAYQHHGIWFARNGYVCLTIDSLQLGEIEGIHHGTYGLRRDGKWHYRWWWFSLGYTPAGVEAWNCTRALDYLQSRPEVDPKRLGVTGRSGGGAYSWWIAAIDPRIRAAVPVAGITDLEDHVVHGTVEGHCDCMFMVNTYRWDYPQVAALVAPRPLLIANTDKDGIFPLRGVVNVYNRVRRVYTLLGALDRVGLQISEGPHRDIQELQVAAFRWFNRHLKNDTRPVPQVAEKLFAPEELKVFKELPSDQINTRVDELFIRRPQPPVPKDRKHWEQICRRWLAQLREKTFGGWPRSEKPHVRVNFNAARENVRVVALEYGGPEGVDRVPLLLFLPAKQQVSRLRLEVVGPEQWKRLQGWFDRFAFAPAQPDQTAWKALQRWFAKQGPTAFVIPRGVGPTAWNPEERHHIQILRRFYLLGQTWDGMRTWDVLQAVRVLESAQGQKLLASCGAKLAEDWRLVLAGRGQEAGMALYAAAMYSGKRIAALELEHLPASHMHGPYLLNVLRVLDIPQAVALVAGRGVRVELLSPQSGRWDYIEQVAQALNWPPERVSIRRPEP